MEWMDERCDPLTAALLLATPFIIMLVLSLAVYFVNGGVPEGNIIEIWRVT